MTTTSPTQRTISLMRKRGWLCSRVEQWNAFARKRIDLCGCDVMCLKEGEPPTLIQVTTASHRNNRMAKLKTLDSALLWIKTGGRIVVHGWKPLTKKRRHYEVIEVDFKGA